MTRRQRENSPEEDSTNTSRPDESADSCSTETGAAAEKANRRAPKWSSKLLPIAAVGTALVLLAAYLLVNSPSKPAKHTATGPTYEPLIPGGPKTLADVCSGICTADIVALPELQVSESVVDLPMPETTGALSIERIWTGERGGLFGKGWESIWDIRVTDGTLTGPLPAEPVDRAQASAEVELEDGTNFQFDSHGRPIKICPDAALCTEAKWSPGMLRLTAASASVQFALANGRTTAASAPDGRTVAYSYQAGRLQNVKGAEDDVSYVYDDGNLAKIDGTAPRSFDYVDGTLHSMTDRDGKQWKFTKAASGDVRVTRPDGEVATYHFTGRKLIEASGSKTGTWAKRTYDGNTLIEETRPRDGVTMKRLPSGEYEVAQKRNLQPDERSILTVDQLGRVVHSESADGESDITYEGRSKRPVSVRKGDATTKFAYDKAGLLTSTTDADGYKVTVDRDPLGQIRSTSDGTLLTKFAYDAAGNTIGEKTAGRATTAKVGSNGQVTSLGLADGAKLPVHYDSTGKLESIGTEQVDTALNTIGDALSDADAVADSDKVEEVLELSNGPEYRYRSGRIANYDQWGRLIRLSGDGEPTTRRYDEAGHLTALELPDGRRYTITYTKAGRIDSIADGTTSANLSWHGDLLARVVTSTGSAYRYTYNGDGQLTSSSIGDARWKYRYDKAGNVTNVVTPSGPISYRWDDRGRPKTVTIDGRVLAYTWQGKDFDLASVTDDGEVMVRFERDGHGRVTGMETPDGRASFDYTGDRLSRYKLANGLEASLTYDADGKVKTIEHGKTTEEWKWSGSELRSVSVDDDRYDLDWLVPGVLSSMTLDGTKTVRVETDRFGRANAVVDAEGKEVGTFKWTDAGIARASLGDWSLKVDYDGDSRPKLVNIDGTAVETIYVDGVPEVVKIDDAALTASYDDGHVASSGFDDNKHWSVVEWDHEGQPTSFKSSEGDGSFEYHDGHVKTVKYDKKVRTVSYDSDGQPSAKDTGGKFIDDLFGKRGTLTTRGGQHLTAPASPWFDALPTELGMQLPTAVTADEIVSAAITQSTPNTPVPLDPGDDIAKRTAESIVALAVPNSLPVAVDRVGTLEVNPGKSGTGTDTLLAASSTVTVGTSAIANLADGPGIFRRTLHVGTGFLDQLGKIGSAIVRFFTDTTVGQAVLSVAFIVGSVVAGTFCTTPVVCPLLGAALFFGPSLWMSGGDLGEAISSTLVEPVRYLWQGIREANPAAMLVGGLGVASFFVARGKLRINPRLARVEEVVFRPFCNRKVVACVSVSRYGEAGQHVFDAQRRGAARILTVERQGASARRNSALRGVPVKKGLDRDEYPPAFSIQRKGLSIRHIDPGSNKSLGRYLGHQIDGLDNGARLFVLPIA